MTVEEAASIVPFPLRFPDSVLANDETQTSLAQCGDSFIQFRYSSGVVLTETVNTLKDAEAIWKQMAKDYPEFSVGKVNGVLASLADPSVEGALGGVDMVTEDGARIIVTGDGRISLADLVGIAESLETR